MKKLSFLVVFSLLTLASCKEKAKVESSPSDMKETVAPPQTYAEISIKVGGHWEGKKYIGDNTFRNVDYLKAPDSLTDHSYYIRYEGPGWESNKVGYRLYFDWRNAIDIFGKKVDTMVLARVGLDNYDSYHEESPWGQDILKAGESLGIGSYGRYDGKVTHHFRQVDSSTVRILNNSENSGIQLRYYGWESNGVRTDLSADLSITPDSRMTRATLKTSEAIEGMTTGIVKFEDIDLMKSEGASGDWGYMATYGIQTLVPDKLGMAIFYNKSDVEKITEGEYDHLLIFKPTTQPISYYLLGAWEQEKGGIKSKEAFVRYLDTSLSEMNR